MESEFYVYRAQAYRYMYTCFDFHSLGFVALAEWRGFSIRIRWQAQWCFPALSPSTGSFDTSVPVWAGRYWKYKPPTRKGHKTNFNVAGQHGVCFSIMRIAQILLFRLGHVCFTFSWQRIFAEHWTFLMGGFSRCWNTNLTSRSIRANPGTFFEPHFKKDFSELTNRPFLLQDKVCLLMVWLNFRKACDTRQCHPKLGLLSWSCVKSCSPGAFP